MHQFALGVEQNIEQAYYWYLLVCANEDTIAGHLLAALWDAYAHVQ